MYDENGFVEQVNGEVYTECKVMELKDHKKKKGGKRFAKWTAGILCAAMLVGGGYMAGSASGTGVGRTQGIAETGGQAAGAGLSGNPGNGGDAQAETVNNLITAAGVNNSGKTLYTPAQIAEKCRSSVVAITAKSKQEVYSMFGQTREYESEGAGSGIIVAKTEEELIIATNNHVVENASELTVCFNDSEEQIYSGYIKGTDPSNDLAVVGVKISDVPQKVLDSLVVAVLGNSDECVMGEQVVAIGNALGYGQSLTSGYISALDRVVTVDNVTYTLIQTDAAINPGNSGGALFNMYGEVIGINSVKFTSEKVEGMGFAIPISKALPILNNLALRNPRDLVEEEDRGYLGISGEDVGTSMSSGYNMPVGLYITRVVEDSAAEKAGVKTGDILTAFDKMAVSGMSQLKNYLQYYKKGEKVEITVKRLHDGNYEEINLTITLGERPDEEESLQNLPKQSVEEGNGYNGDFGFDWDDFFGGFWR
ncbi:MAG: trypsin-like peptidase domain-containing protein [Lachnospiraceae bacterium]|nr:trypsin-like peptidase domain-containing protein [Lachnospiraceae bacterium]